MQNPLYETLLGRHAQSEKVFIKTIDDRTVTYNEFLTTANRFANLFAEIGLSKGDRVAAQIDKSVEGLCLYVACVQSGIVFLPLNVAYTSSEIEYFLSDSGSKLFICDPSKELEFESVLSESEIKIYTMSADRDGTFFERSDTMSNKFEIVSTEEGDLAAFLYTSGTTGRSKGAMLTQKNLLSNAKALTEFWEFDSTDVLIHALPIFHTHGLFVAINVSLLSGATIILMPNFQVNKVMEHLPTSTTMMGVPTFYTRLLAEEKFNRELVAGMRLFVSGSAPLLAETHIEFEQRTGHRILERYGMTETNMNTSNPYSGERKPGTVGLPLPGVEVKVTDSDSGSQLGVNQVGMVEVRGPNVFKGYWNMPEKTKADLRDNGFFITGDLGKLDQDGYLHIVGRGKDLIISGGYNIYPKEIEQILDEQENVVESAVVGVPHPDFGETPVGVLVRKSGLEPDLESIRKVVARDLARFKYPRRLFVVDELPRNAMGKVQKNILQEKYKRLFS